MTLPTPVLPALCANLACELEDHPAPVEDSNLSFAGKAEIPCQSSFGGLRETWAFQAGPSAGLRFAGS